MERYEFFFILSFDNIGLNAYHCLIHEYKFCINSIYHQYYSSPLYQIMFHKDILDSMTNFVPSKLVWYKWMIWARFITTKALIHAHLSPSLIFFSLIPIIFHIISYPIILHYNDKIIGAQLKCKKWMIGKRIPSTKYHVIYSYDRYS